MLYTDPWSRLPVGMADRELAWVLGATWWGARLWRSLAAAWRCARAAA